MNTRIQHSSASRGFTMVELLVAITVLALMVTMLADVLVRTQDTVTRANTQVTEFQEARAALDSMSYSLS
ncbi:MAG: type II secretion system protein J, partial [Roseimicrobium sp.]